MVVMLMYFWEQFCYGSGHLLDGFMVLDIDYIVFVDVYYGCFSLIASFSNVNVDANTSHARLGDIRQDRMNKLA